MAVTRAQGRAKGGAVWVWLPRDREGVPTSAAAELLYEGGALARRWGVPLVALDGLPPSPGEAAWLGRWGVSGVRHLGRALPPHPDVPDGRPPLGELADWPAPTRPRAVLFAADSFGSVTAPLLAAQWDAHLVSGAASVTANGERCTVARPALGGQYETLSGFGAEAPLVATLLPRTVGDDPTPPRGVKPVGAPEILGPEDAATGTPHPPESPPQPLLPPDPRTLELADAERIVAYGRGAFSNEAVALVERLAEALGAVVAGTRPAADEGWLPFSRQIGLTGAIVHPRLYVAVGISGAPYHMTGVKEPRTLIAINSDPEAPIFAHAHLGVVGRLEEVLPALLEQLAENPGATDGAQSPLTAAAAKLSGGGP